MRRYKFGSLSFNSQRDGILHEFAKREGKNSTVSIPNGMEFYLAAELVRDGAKLFQFPTGWNSTQMRGLVPNRCAKVSIPNGMEFYPRLSLNSLVTLRRFNSQRDGILHRPHSRFFK